MIYTAVFLVLIGRDKRRLFQQRIRADVASLINVSEKRVTVFCPTLLSAAAAWNRATVVRGALAPRAMNDRDSLTLAVQMHIHVDYT